MTKSTSSFSELAQMYFPGCATPKNASAMSATQHQKMYKIGNIVGKNRLSSLQSPLAFAQAANAYIREFGNHTLIKFLKRHKKTAFHTVICRFFCTYISIISFIVLKRLLINYETIVSFR